MLQMIHAIPETPRIRQRRTQDADLFDLEEKLVEAHVNWLRALDHQAEADRQYYLVRSVAAREARSTIREYRARRASLREDRTVDLRGNAAARRSARLRPAERAVERAETKLSRIVRAMLRMRTRTLAGMACKMRILHIRPDAAVMDSLEADLRAMALLP